MLYFKDDAFWDFREGECSEIGWRPINKSSFKYETNSADLMSPLKCSNSVKSSTYNLWKNQLCVKEKCRCVEFLLANPIVCRTYVMGIFTWGPFCKNMPCSEQTNRKPKVYTVLWDHRAFINYTMYYSWLTKSGMSSVHLHQLFTLIISLSVVNKFGALIKIDEYILYYAVIIIFYFIVIDKKYKNSVKHFC